MKNCCLPTAALNHHSFSGQLNDMCDQSLLCATAVNRCGMHGSNTSGETSSAIASPGLPAKPLCQYQLDALTERVLHGTMSPSLRNFRPNVCILHLLETQAHNLKGASLLPGHGVESILTSHTGPLYQCMCEQETAKLKRDQARCLVLMAHAEQIAHVHRRLQPDACDLAGKCVVATCGQDLWFFFPSEGWNDIWGCIITLYKNPYPWMLLSFYFFLSFYHEECVIVLLSFYCYRFIFFLSFFHGKPSKPNTDMSRLNLTARGYYTVPI